MTTETVERVVEELEKQANFISKYPSNRNAILVLNGIAAALRDVLKDYPAGESCEF